MRVPRNPLLLIDSFALLFRAYAALPPLEYHGKPLGAVYGFLSILYRFILKTKPQNIIAAFDRPEPTLRKIVHQEYKAQRPEPATDLVVQISELEKALSWLKIPIISFSGYEADDIIATIARQASQEHDVVILTGDKDMLQLIDDRVWVLTPKIGFGSDTLYNKEVFKNKYDFSHTYWVDYKALRGDPSDNLPGAKGIGEKIATELVKKFGDCESIISAAKERDIQITPRVQNLVISAIDEIRFTKKMVSIDAYAPVSFDFLQSQWPQFSSHDVMHLKTEFGFTTLTDKFLVFLKNENKNFLNSTDAMSTYSQSTQKISKQLPTINNGVFLRKIEVNEKNFSEFKKLWFQSKRRIITLKEDTVAHSNEKMFKGIYCKCDETTVWMIPLSFCIEHNSEVQEVLSVRFITYSAKHVLHLFSQEGWIIPHLIDDVSLMLYCISCYTWSSSLLENGKKIGVISEVQDADEYTEVIVCEALYIWTYQTMYELSQGEIYEKMEKPLPPILTSMENAGMKIDKKYLTELELELTARKNEVLSELNLYTESKDFNPDSPKQVADVLFNRLCLDKGGSKKNKTGWSTDAHTLAKLSQLHPFPALLLEYRELSKLLNTYVRVLPKVCDKDERVHTHFNQTITATGRLSSSDPNLQNIPTRTDLGKSVRRAFVAREGMLLVSMDYSQLELRVAAFLAKEHKMLHAFSEGQDIHAWTASLLHNIPLQSVTPEMRRAAKEINFGILYGMGVFGLAERTGLTRAQAKKFIEDYFFSFPNIQSYLAEVITFGKTHGYVETFFGRRRYLPGLKGSTRERAVAERAAVNYPMQGTAADIMKRAMIRVYECIKNDPDLRGVHLISQVHDELLFEVPSEKIQSFVKKIAHEMKIVNEFPGPLQVNARCGENWEDLKEVT